MTPLSEAKRLVELGIELSDAGRKQDAEGAYRAAVQAYPDWSVPWYNLGLLCKYQLRWTESLTCNQRAAQLDPADQASWWNLGIAATALVTGPRRGAPDSTDGLPSSAWGDTLTRAPGRSIAAIREIDPDQPLYDVRTLEAVVDRTLARRWLQTVLLGGFAVLALLLAVVGVYGVIAYAVGQRLREFGIRMALGARRRDIVALVITRGGRLLALGAGLGLLGAVVSVRVLRTLLHGVRPLDPGLPARYFHPAGCRHGRLPPARAPRRAHQPQPLTSLRITGNHRN